MSYHIGSKIKVPAKHHESFKDLWETKWKMPCSMSVYPFMFGKLEDFEPVVAKLTEMEMCEPYDWDKYANAFFPTAEMVVAKAEEAERTGDRKQASDLYMRASALYRIARFPIPRSDVQHEAWRRNKECALKGLSLADIPMKEHQIPHLYAVEGEEKTIPVYAQMAATASKESPAPCVIIFTGLDGYRTELAIWKNVFLPRGCSLIIAEIPGTGDSPALKEDPKSPDRLWSSLFDWVDAQASIDRKKVIVWGFSTGGYYSIRIAHTHADRLLGVVSQGGGCHHMFDPEWLDEVNHLEYPFDLADALAYKFGYSDLEAFKRDARAKYSLAETGILDMPCTKLLLVNGTDDEVYPIDDYMLCLEHGGPKEVRFVRGIKHMGEPLSFKVILTWIFGLLDIRGPRLAQGGWPDNTLRNCPTKYNFTVSMRSTAVCLLRRSIIEVERKFRCDPELIGCFRANGGDPAFRSMKHLGRRNFEDIYFDRDGTLCSHGVWVRRRGSHWQAKVRQQGDYVNSQFEELSEPEDIARVIKKFNLDVRPASEDFGLRQMARFTTFREEWKVNERFGVVLDTTNFGHCIGEVELEQAIEVDDGDENSVARRQDMATKMDREIEAFMKQHPWAFPLDKPVGKLSAYFLREEKAGQP